MELGITFPVGFWVMPRLLALEPHFNNHRSETSGGFHTRSLLEATQLTAPQLSTRHSQSEQATRQVPQSHSVSFSGRQMGRWARSESQRPCFRSLVCTPNIYSYQSSSRDCTARPELSTNGKVSQELHLLQVSNLQSLRFCREPC